MTLIHYGRWVIDLLGIYSMVILITSLFLIVKAYGRGKRLLTAVCVAESLLIMPLYMSFRLALKTQRLFKGVLPSADQIPLWLIILIEAGFTLVFVCQWILLAKSEKNQITENSVREGLDNMPDGIAFSTPDGIPLLVNNTMRNIVHRAFHAEVVDTLELTERYKNGDFDAGCSLIQSDDAAFLMLQDQTVWNITQKDILINGKPFSEIIANDITQQYNLSVELKSRNQRLEEINRRIKAYSANLDATVRESEILAAKIKVHDNVGQSLLALRAYLQQENGDRKQLLEIWNFTVALLRGEATPIDSADPIEALIQAGKAVGVDILFNGALPEDSRYRELLTLAIHECLTNTVKHADGTLMNIQTNRTEDAVTVTISNDGNPPKAPVKETGGLKNLRNKAKDCGVTMQIESSPRFLLTLTIRKEKPNV